jgi:hypothetical protein
MSCTPLYSVHCDGGGPACEGWTAQEETRASARLTAKLRGWVTRRQDGRTYDYCPNCWKGAST